MYVYFWPCMQDVKIDVYKLPQVQLPISHHGTMYSSSHYDKMIKQKELITADTKLLQKKQEFTTRMNDISKKKVASKQKWDKVFYYKNMWLNARTQSGL